MANNEPHIETRSPHDILSSIEDYKISIDRFKKDRMISECLFKVYSYTEKATNKQIEARFIFYLKRYKEFFYKTIKLSIMVNYHPCFKKFIGFDIIKRGGVIFYDFCPNHSLDIILEQQKKNQSKTYLNDTNKLIIIYGIAAGMSFLHSHDIYHPYLNNTENILFDEYLHPKLCDFGCSKEIEKLSKTGPSIKMKTTIYAPELFQDDSNPTKPVDIFSFAMLLYKIITNENPFEGDNQFTMMSKILDNKRPEFKKPISECYRKLIERCWSQDPEMRPTFDQIVEELETNKAFITENSVDESEYYKYIEFVKNPGNVTYDEDDRIDIDRIEKVFHINLQPISLGLFTKLNKIGSGGFGKVFKVLEKETGKNYACKISRPLETFKDIEIRNLQREICIISKLEHPIILKFIGFSPINFKKSHRPAIITELITNGSLDIILDIERKGLSEENWNDTKKLINIYGIAKGMSYLHSLNILHRDLKPGNIFIDDYLFPKIGDFGLSKELVINDDDAETSYQSPIEKLSSGNMGTIPYMSPEIIRNNEYTKPGDVYAFSLIAYQIITNEEIYKNFGAIQIQFFVANGNRPKFPSDTKKCYRELIEKCWDQNPDERPTFDDIVEELENNPDFITDTMNEVEFFNYVEYIKQLVPNNSQSDKKQEMQNNKKKYDQLFQKNSNYLKLAEDVYDENDPSINEGFLDLTKYEEVKLQNQGDTWKLVEVKNKETGEVFSAKITTIKLNKMGKSDIIKLSREINNIAQIKHPSILKFIGYSRKNLLGKKRPVIVSEYVMNGTMSGILERERQKKYVLQWDGTQKLIIIYGIAEGMRFLHSHKIIHRDLTPENIFLDEQFNPKIGGFGVSINIHTQESVTYQSTVGVKGNPVYSPPEVLQINEYSKSSDVYSFGMIIYEIMTNKIPFENFNNLNHLFNEVVLKSSRPEIDESVPKAYSQLIQCCWAQNPEDRPSFDDIVNILKTDKKFITDDVEQEKYLGYIKLIENSKIEFFGGKKIFHQNDFIISKNNDNKGVTTANGMDSSDDEEEMTEKIKEREVITEDIEIKDAEESVKQEDEIEATKEQEAKIEEIEETKVQEEKIEDIKETKEQEEKIEEIKESIVQEEKIEEIKESIVQEEKIEEVEESKKQEAEIEKAEEQILIKKETSCELAKKFSLENDTENTYIYMNKSISEGSPHVALEYAVHLYKTNHFAESMKYFITLGKFNHPIAKYYIGIMKYFGQGCEEDRIESHSIMRYLSENGIERATDFLENHFDKKF